MRISKLQIIIGVVFLLVVVSLVVLFSTHQTSKKPIPIFTATPSPIPLSFSPKIYTSVDNQYQIQIPQEWNVQKNSSNQDKTTTITYSENNNSYIFTSSPPGSAIGDASLMHVDTLEMSPVNYGGRNFLLKIWSYQGTPVLIQALPNEQGFIYDSFSMQLPPTNTQKYIDIFNQIMSELQIPQSLQSSPQPTIDGAQVLHISPPPSQ